MRRRVLVVEPYYAGSHRAWADGLQRHSRHDVRLVVHAGGFWKWRMQGGALTLAESIDVLTRRWRPDVVVVSDMVHVPALLGLARDALAGTAVVVYFHENQLTYPLRDDAAADDTYAMTNWLSAAAADAVVFNSAFHLDSFFDAVSRLLRRLPDHRHVHRVDDVRARASVLPVGIDVDRFTRRRPHLDPPVVLWNHRWEYDKDPVAFFDALRAVRRRGIDFGLVLAGERFQTVPAAFETAFAEHSERLIEFGTASPLDYPAILAASDIVVSTSRHEFFGVAVLEAIVAGALPILPERLSYPELVPRRAPYLYADERDLVDRLCAALTDGDARRAAAREATAHTQRFSWHAVAPAYDDLIEVVEAARRHRR